MAVTDLTDSLPWWARQGGPTGTPSATPQGGSATPTGGSAPPGVSPQAWLQYLSQMFGPGAGPSGPPAQPPFNPLAGGSANTGQPQGGNPANMPSPDASNVSALYNMGNPPPPPAGSTPGGTTMVNLNNGGAPPQPSFNPLAGGSANTGLPAQPPGPPAAPGAMPARPAGVSATGLPLQPGALSPGALAYFANAGGGIGSGGNVPAPSGGGSMAPGPAVNPGGAGGVGATSNPRFIGIDRPNAPAEGNPYSRGGPQGTALNLAGMFSRGQPAANAPAAAAQPVAGPLARPDLAQRVPLANAPMPPVMPPDVAAARQPLDPRVARARMLQPNYYG